MLYRVLPILMLAFALARAVTAQDLFEQPVRVQLMPSEPAISVRTAGLITVRSGDESVVFDSGSYTLTPVLASPPPRRFHLFAKTFKLTNTDAQDDYVAEMRAQGHTPEVITIGKRIETASARVIDTRVNWVSLRQAGSMVDAERLKKSLEIQGHFAWIQAENAEPGRGFIRIQTPNGTILASLPAPATVSAPGPIAVDDVDVGFWNEKERHLTYIGNLEVGVSTKGELELIEVLPIDEYLRGVLPAEMPWKWSSEALKAQAVAARSDVLANLGSRYTLEGFDFLGNEQSRAYLGESGFRDTTDAALETTRGEILAAGERIVQTVFSATCGGWTENNDTVWYGPPDAALRGRRDASTKTRSVEPDDRETRDRLLNPPNAYCSHDEAYFRWSRTYSHKELRDIINDRYKIGDITEIELGERGVSGRLKWIRFYGTKGTETIHKELSIRRALGGLPSAMFVLKKQTNLDGFSSYTLDGGGRGHGVGMCQNGAQGMALQGKGYDEILAHYFEGAQLEQCR